MSRSSNKIIRSRHNGRRNERHTNPRYRARFAYDTLSLLPIFVQASQRVSSVKILSCDREGSMGLLGFHAVVGIHSWQCEVARIFINFKKDNLCIQLIQKIH